MLSNTYTLYRYSDTAPIHLTKAEFAAWAKSLKVRMAYKSSVVTVLPCGGTEIVRFYTINGGTWTLSVFSELAED